MAPTLAATRKARVSPASDTLRLMPSLFRKQLTPPEPTVLPNPEQAWRLLALINEWIRHSDAKAAVTLAFTAAMGTMLFNLVDGFTDRTLIFDAAVVVATLLILLGAAFCAWTLTPRITDQEASPEQANLLFFGSIAVKFKNDRGNYREELRLLTADPAALTRDLTDQIHANANIAAVKARAIQRGIRSALAAAAAVAAVAVIVGITHL